MKSVLDFFPDFCPGCGKSLRATNPESDRINISDFVAGAAHSCDCGFRFAHAPSGEIKELAAKHGDAGRFW